MPRVQSWTVFWTGQTAAHEFKTRTHVGSQRYFVRSYKTLNINYYTLFDVVASCAMREQWQSSLSGTTSAVAYFPLVTWVCKQRGKLHGGSTHMCRYHTYFPRSICDQLLLVTAFLLLRKTKTSTFLVCLHLKACKMRLAFTAQIFSYAFRL